MSAALATEAFTPTETQLRTPWFGRAMTWVWIVAAANLLLHLLTATRYGYFGDELYFMDCARHLAWGYVDQPPLIAVVIWLVRHTLGDSLFALHLLPAICGAALVVMTGRMALELGAERFGAGLAALACSLVGFYFVNFHLMTMNSFEPLIWTGCAWIVLRIVQTGNQRLWLWFGVLSGVGLENKYSTGVFGFAIVVGLLLTPQRKAFASRWIWIAGAIAALIFLPNVIWNYVHHFPFLELMRNIREEGRDVVLGPVAFLVQQIMTVNPILLPIWAGGLGWLMFARDGRRYRVLGWAYIVTLVVMIVSKGKDYYVAPAYPMLFAAGGVAIERAIAWSRQAWLKPAYAVLMIAFTAPFVPLLVPVLPLDALLRYQQHVHLPIAATEKAHAMAKLPHYYAWELGWPDLVAQVAQVYNSLPAEERAHTAIYAKIFGAAGAIDLMGKQYGLPDVIGGHQNYWIWGPRDYTGSTLIIVGERYDDDKDECRDLTVAATHFNPYGAVWENRPILLCRGLKFNLQDSKVWAKVKNWG